MNFKTNVVTSAIVKGTKVSAKATAKAAAVTGSAIKDGTLYVTDYVELGTAKTTSAIHNHVVVPVTNAKVKHDDAKGERILARMYARDAKKAAKAAKAIVEATETTVTTTTTDAS